MKYYSDTLKQFFDTEKECVVAEKEEKERVAKAEKALAEKTAARKQRAKEVEDARDAAIAAQKHYNELLTTFCKDYPEGYHQTISVKDMKEFADLVNWLF